MSSKSDPSDLEKLKWIYSACDLSLKNSRVSSNLLPIVGPSGVGKTALVNALENLSSKYYTIPNVTTRKKRPSDPIGHFKYVSEEVFFKKVDDNEFLMARVGGDPCYGYEISDVKNAIMQDKICIFMFRYSGIKYFARQFEAFTTIYLKSDLEVISRMSLDTHKLQTMTLVEETQIKCEEVIDKIESKGWPVIKLVNSYNGEEELEEMAKKINEKLSVN